MTKRQTRKVATRPIVNTKTARDKSRATRIGKRNNAAVSKRTSGSKCKICSKSFDDTMAAAAHQKCCFSSARESNLFTNYDGKVKFICTVCSQLFQFETGLKKHEQRHRPPGGFVCSVCNERFLTEAERLLHKETVHKIFKCLLCDSKFTSEKTYLAHIAQQHGGRDRDYLVCSDCGTQFRQPNQLRLHNESKCGTIRSYSCRECSSKFISQNTLNAHMLIHTGDKKHLCDFCGKSFLSRGQLQVHERCHTGERPFKCDLCNKAFSHRESLVTHSSVHTGIKPYVCEACDSRFSCIGNLIKHRRARPQTCGLPQYSSNSKCAPRPSSKHVGSLTIKMSPKTKRSYGKRKAISVPELLAVRMEMTANDEGAKPKIDCSAIDSKADLDLVETMQMVDAKYDVPGQEMSVYDDVQEIDWAEHIDQSDVNDKMDTNAITPLGATTIFDENATAYNVIVTEHGSFILSNYDPTAMTDGATIHEVTLPIDVQPSVIHHQEEVIILNANDFVDDVANENIPIETETIECEEANVTSNFIMDHSYVANGYDLNDSDTIVAAVKTKIRPRRAVTEPSQYSCKYCDLKYASAKRLQNDVECRDSDGTFKHKCHCKPRYFASVDEMERPKMEQHEDILTCNVCQKKFKDTESLHNHVKFVHEKRKKTIACQMCPKCGKKFASNYALNDHENSDCGRSPNYKCLDCGKFYHSAGSLKSHRLIHTGEMPYVCNVCDKAFRNKGQLKIHSRCHSGEKPYKCEYCEKSFAHRESLLTHTSLHTGIKRFMCQGCGNRFSCISNLQAHRRSHKTQCGLLPIITKPISWTTDHQPGAITAADVKITANHSVAEKLA